ncbi:MAG TPA: radical SAM protein [Chitinispirillaceae bacterium]|nr:radical SAM protein [Chitinispirillaceae bacterium]
MIEPLLIDKNTASNRSAIVSLHNKGEFWKPCPGTTQGYLCCGYQILTPSTGCGMYCKYCILQAYFPHQCQILFDNFDDLEKEVHTKLNGNSAVIRFGTGEFGDSLYSEHKTGVARKVAALLEPYQNVIVEFKTKSTNIEPLKAIRIPQKIIIGFSLNTPAMIERMENGTASLQQRLDLAVKCIEMGFYVAFHFDPMFIYANWEAEYRNVVKGIFKKIADPSRIAWVSMGGFRTMPSLKTHLKSKNDHLGLFSGEMVAGMDGKLRYFRPLRTALYKAVAEEFELHYPEITLYLCMESPEVWNDAGMKKRIPDGLVKYLDRRAEYMLRHG